MHASHKPLVWLRSEVKSPPFSAQARLEAGMLLRQLQGGELIALPQSRPMPSIGKSCHELRIVDTSQSWRIVYAIHPQAIVILHVFKKTTQQTPKTVIALCKARLNDFTNLIESNEKE